MNVALLTLTTLLVVVPAAAVAEWGLGSGQVLPAAAAVGLCLPVAIVTLVVGAVVNHRWPQYAPVAVMAGVGVRMAGAVVGVLVLAGVMERAGVDRDSFARWVLAVYLVTLVAESALQIRGVGRRVGTP